MYGFTDPQRDLSFYLRLNSKECLTLILRLSIRIYSYLFGFHLVKESFRFKEFPDTVQIFWLWRIMKPLCISFSVIYTKLLLNIYWCISNFIISVDIISFLTTSRFHLRYTHHFCCDVIRTVLSLRLDSVNPPGLAKRIKKTRSKENKQSTLPNSTTSYQKF